MHAQSAKLAYVYLHMKKQKIQKDMKRWLYIVLLLLASTIVRANGDTLSVAERNAQLGFNDTIDRMAEDFVEAYVVIVDPSGESMYSIFGHACLRLTCPYYGLDYFYSYVSEDIEGKVFRFLLNDLKMGLVALTYDEYIHEYAAEGRGVRMYKLNLPPEVEVELCRICDRHVSEGMYLEYDYMKRGCTVSIVHMINEAITAANKTYSTQYSIEYPEWDKSFNRTIREIGYENAIHDWNVFFAMILGGGTVDNPNIPKVEKIIIPKDLIAIWQKAKLNGYQLLDTNPIDLLPTMNEYHGNKISPILIVVLLLILSIFNILWSKPYFDWIILGIQTLLGLLMVWLLFSPLPGSEWNWLIIPFNPLPAICWKWRDKWAIPYAIVIVMWSIGMILSPHRLVGTEHLLLAMIFVIVLVKSYIRKTLKV